MRFATRADIPRIEEICNDPVIRIWTAPEGWPPCKAEQYVTEPSFTVLLDDGCFLAKHIDAKRFAVHANLLPSCRGRKAVDAGRQALALAFTRAEELWAMIPAALPHSIWLARHVGFVRQTRSYPLIWPVCGFGFNLRCYRLTRAEWFKQFEGENRKEVCDA